MELQKNIPGAEYGHQANPGAVIAAAGATVAAESFVVEQGSVYVQGDHSQEAPALFLGAGDEGGPVKVGQFYDHPFVAGRNTK